MHVQGPNPTPEADALTEERNIRRLRRGRSKLGLGVAGLGFFAAAALAAVWILAPQQPGPGGDRIAAAPAAVRETPAPAPQPAQGGPLVPVGGASAAPPAEARASVAAALPAPQPTLQPSIPEPAPAPRPEPAQTIAALPPAPPAPPSRPRISSEEANLLIERAERALREQRDVIAARQFLQRAEQGGHARAAFLLAETFDPAILTTLGVRGVRADPARARALYEQAQAGGVAEAASRLERLR